MGSHGPAHESGKAHQKEKHVNSKSAAAREEEDDDEEDETYLQPITDSRTVRFKLRTLNKNLICALCAGYYREPYTIIECLHTFCKSCLTKYFLEDNRYCPTCNADMGPNPRSTCMFDRSMQEILRKILPTLDAEDENAETEFYTRLKIPPKRKLTPTNNGKGEPTKKVKDADGSSSGRHSQADKGESGGGIRRQSSASSHDNSRDVEISLNISPDVSELTPKHLQLRVLEKPYLSTSGKLKVLHLKKYIAKKLKGGIEPDNIEILCKGEVLGPELSLHFIERTRWHDASDLCLTYRRKMAY